MLAHQLPLLPAVPPAPSELIARARRGDPETSAEAAMAFTATKLRESQGEVLTLLRRCGPMTDTKIAEAAERADLHLSPSGLRTRRAELVALGAVEDSGVRETLPSGRRSIVWRAKGVA